MRSSSVANGAVPATFRDAAGFSAATAIVPTMSTATHAAAAPASLACVQNIARPADLAIHAALPACAAPAAAAETMLALSPAPGVAPVAAAIARTEGVTSIPRDAKNFRNFPTAREIR